MLKHSLFIALALAPVAGALFTPIAAFAKTLKIFKPDGLAVHGVDPADRLMQSTAVQACAARGSRGVGATWRAYSISSQALIKRFKTNSNWLELSA